MESQHNIAGLSDTFELDEEKISPKRIFDHIVMAGVYAVDEHDDSNTMQQYCQQMHVNDVEKL